MRQPAATGFVGWLLSKQALFYRELSGLIRATKSDGTALWGLMGISFAYGIFHAAGPGHGKAVISSYLVANEETWRRGVILSFASALLQALTAVVLVAVAAILIGATAKAMGDTVRVIETISYALIVLVGARLLWVKGRAFLRTLHALKSEPAPAAEHAHDHHVPRVHIMSMHTITMRPIRTMTRTLTGMAHITATIMTTTRALPRAPGRKNSRPGARARAPRRSSAVHSIPSSAGPCPAKSWPGRPKIQLGMLSGCLMVGLVSQRGCHFGHA